MTKLQFFPLEWKVAQIVMLLEPDKQPEEAKSYRPHKPSTYSIQNIRNSTAATNPTHTQRKKINS